MDELVRIQQCRWLIFIDQKDICLSMSPIVVFVCDEYNHSKNFIFQASMFQAFISDFLQLT